MTTDDLINHLDPDMIYCLITKQWINVNKQCEWDITVKENSCEKYWTCVDHCKRFKHNLKTLEVKNLF